MPCYIFSNKYSCNICKKTFVFAVNVQKHKWLAHTRVSKAPVGIEGVRPVDKSQAKLKRQIERNEDRICSICGIECSSWKQLNVHMMDHTKERPHKCNVCGKGFKEQQKLKRHMVMHTGEKKFKCSFCGKGFGLRHNMKSHEKIHEGKGRFCKYCGKMFTQVTNLRSHEEKHAKKRHVVTTDPALQQKQTIVTSGRGRPSILAIDAKRKDAEESMEAETDTDDARKSSPAAKRTRVK